MDSRYPPRQSKQPLVLTALGTLAAAFLFWAAFLRPSASVPETPFVTKAVAVLQGDFGAGGTVVLTQANLGAPVNVTGRLTGLDARALRGFHIHTSGDLSSGCASAGAHFNPLGLTHGAPSDVTRHAGDLGNILSDGEGVALFSIEDSVISLNGPTSVVGRAIVLHTGTDDLGRADNDESLKTGNAGARAACGVIGKCFPRIERHVWTPSIETQRRHCRVIVKWLIRPQRRHTNPQHGTGLFVRRRNIIARAV
ncbi:hypothetical protein IEO21_04095 [Rhodonia placenta]|uniref:Superoxide dismutase [Cu-Zn] n=1 Tax=Rhodonia placenta TaxID=104341 RepID=A0A8H7P4B4_9APHY|nr:hypothetical protein IEO21_04095 [Postia placenta]